MKQFHENIFCQADFVNSEHIKFNKEETLGLILTPTINKV